MEDELKKLMDKCIADAKELAYNDKNIEILAVELFRERVKKKNPSHR